MAAERESVAGNGPTRAGRLLAALRVELQAERARWLLWLPVALGAGVGAYFSLPSEPPPWLGAGGAAAGLVGGWLLRQRTLPCVLLLALGLGSLGFGAAQLRTVMVAAPVLEKRHGPARVEGQILRVEPRPGGGRMVLRRLEIAGLEAARTPERVRIRQTKRDPGSFAPGDWIRVRAILRPPPPPSAPGAFDFARAAYFQGLGAVGFAVGHVEALAVQGPSATWLAGWRLWWSGLRHAVARRVLDVLPDRSGAVAAALMTGERGAIPAHVTEAMRDSGLAHLLAISGLHMGLLAGLLFFGLRALLALVPALALNYPIKKWAAVAAALGAGGYLFLVGAPVPTQRAFVMVGLALLAVLLDRNPISLRLVAWAAVAVLLLAPESLLSASFQMSFGAVTALVAAYEALALRRHGRRAERGLVLRLSLYMAGVALTSVIAIAATAPFAVYHFNRVALYGLAANLVAVPLTACWIMPWALFAFALMPLGLEALALTPMSWGIEAVLVVAETIAALPGAVSPVRAMPPAGLVLVVLGGLWLCLWQRPWRLAGLAAVAAGLATILWREPPHVLVNDDGRLLAVRGADGGLLLSSARRGRFTAETWLRRAGESEGLNWPRDGPSEDGRLLCDNLGCIYRAAGQVVALVRDGRALSEDCRIATVLISTEPLRGRACPAPSVVIDRFDLWRHGSHALWLAPDRVRVETVAGHRGARPWAPGRKTGTRGAGSVRQ